MLPPSGLKQDCRYLKPRTGSTVGRHSLSGFNTNPVCTKYTCTAPSRGTKVNSKKKKHWFSTTGFRILLNSPSLKIRLYRLLAKFSFQYCHVRLCSANPHSFFQSAVNFHIHYPDIESDLTYTCRCEKRTK